MTDTKNSDFLRLLLDGAKGYGWVCAFAGNPGDPEQAKWYGRPWLPSEISDAEVDAYGDRNSYFSVAELDDAEGRRSRQKQNFRRLRALVVDDVIDGVVMGTPTYSIETSPGKVQTGVFIDANDADAADAAVVDAIMSELYQRKLLGDNSGNNLVRYVRLPQGTNSKPRSEGPWQHRLLLWNPGAVYSLEDACGVFGIDLDEVKAKAKTIAPDMILTGDVDQARLMAEAIQQVVTGETYHEPLNRIAASLTASGAHPGAVVNLLRGMMSAAQAPRDSRWEDRYKDIPRAVQTASRKFQVEPWAPPGEPVEEQPLLVGVKDILADTKPIQWLVKGWLEERSLSCLFGPPGVGKSFIAFDLAAAVATGTPWHGCATRKGSVILVVGEGKAGVGRRLRAWMKERKIDLSEARLHVTTKPVPMLDAAAAYRLVEAIDAVIAETGEPPALIVIDTLARNFGDGDENSAKDASAFVAAVDELLRQRYGAHVMVVHHSGHEAGRARGSSAFKAAWDQEFAATDIAAAGLVKFAATKMKDAEKPTPMEFQLKEIVYDESADGDKIESLVPVKMGNEWDEILVNGKELKITVGWMLDRLVGQYMPSQAQLVEAGASTKAAKSAVARLAERGLIAKAGAHNSAQWQITDAGKLLMSRVGRALGRDLDGHNGKAAADDVIGD